MNMKYLDMGEDNDDNIFPPFWEVRNASDTFIWMAVHIDLWLVL